MNPTEIANRLDDSYDTLPGLLSDLRDRRQERAAFTLESHMCVLLWAVSQLMKSDGAAPAEDPFAEEEAA